MSIEDFDEIFEKQQMKDENQFDLTSTLETLINRKNNEVMYYRKVLKLYESLSESERLDFDIKRCFKDVRSKKDIISVLIRYFKLRCGDNYKWESYIKKFFIKQNEEKSYQQILDNRSSYLYGRFNEDFETFYIGEQLNSMCKTKCNI